MSQGFRIKTENLSLNKKWLMPTHTCSFNKKGKYNNNDLCPNLNYVSDHARHDLLMNTISESRNAWLFSFKFNGSGTESKILSSIQDYFQGFQNKTLESQIFVHVDDEDGTMMQFFEVFRKSVEDLKLTITLLCHKSKTPTNLTGIHMRVGHAADNVFFKKNNQVTVI